RVDANAGAAALYGEVENVEDAPRACDDHRQPRREWLALRMGALEARAPIAVEEVEVARHRISRVLGLDCDCVGGIHKGRPPVGGRATNRGGRRLNGRADGVNIVRELLVWRRGFDDLVLDAAHVFDAQDGPPADRPPVDFDETAGQSRRGHWEA